MLGLRRREPVRFDSFRFRTFRILDSFGSEIERFGSVPLGSADSVRFSCPFLPSSRPAAPAPCGTGPRSRRGPPSPAPASAASPPAGCVLCLLVCVFVGVDFALLVYCLLMCFMRLLFMAYVSVLLECLVYRLLLYMLFCCSAYRLLYFVHLLQLELCCY